MHNSTTFLPIATERRCDAQLKISRRRAGSKPRNTCGALASFYDPARMENLCGLHAEGRAVEQGGGRAWYDDCCETPGHEHRSVRAIGADGVKRCLGCSFDYELVRPAPPIDEIMARLRGIESEAA